MPASSPATLGACCRRPARGTIGLGQPPVRAAERGPQLGSGHLGCGTARSARRLCSKLLMLAASAEIPLQTPQEGNDLVWHFMVPLYTIALILQVKELSALFCRRSRVRLCSPVDCSRPGSLDRAESDGAESLSTAHSTQMKKRRFQECPCLYVSHTHMCSCRVCVYVCVTKPSHVAVSSAQAPSS